LRGIANEIARVLASSRIAWTGIEGEGNEVVAGTTATGNEKEAKIALGVCTGAVPAGGRTLLLSQSLTIASHQCDCVGRFASNFPREDAHDPKEAASRRRGHNSLASPSAAAMSVPNNCQPQSRL